MGFLKGLTADAVLRDHLIQVAVIVISCYISIYIYINIIEQMSMEQMITTSHNHGKMIEYHYNHGNGTGVPFKTRIFPLKCIYEPSQFLITKKISLFNHFIGSVCQNSWEHRLGYGIGAIIYTECIYIYICICTRI